MKVRALVFVSAFSLAGLAMLPTPDSHLLRLSEAAYLSEMMDAKFAILNQRQAAKGELIDRLIDRRLRLADVVRMQEAINRDLPLGVDSHPALFGPSGYGYLSAERVVAEALNRLADDPRKSEVEARLMAELNSLGCSGELDDVAPGVPGRFAAGNDLARR